MRVNQKWSVTRLCSIIIYCYINKTINKNMFFFVNRSSPTNVLTKYFYGDLYKKNFTTKCLSLNKTMYMDLKILGIGVKQILTTYQIRLFQHYFALCCF